MDVSQQPKAGSAWPGSSAFGAAVATFSCLLAAAACAGLWDLAENAAGSGARESIATVCLWIVLAAIPALVMALIAAALAVALPRRPSGAIVTAVLWAALQGSTLLAAKVGWIGVPSALVVSALILVVAGSIARAPAPRQRVRPWSALLLVAAIPAAAVVGWCRPGLPVARERPNALEAGAATATGPNVVLIVLDTLRRDHLGAYGDARGLSPAFDELAARSTLYEDAFATASWTVPSHASLFTGLAARAHGATCDEHRWLDERFTTLAESLAERGYDTAAFSANRYLRESNLAQGFDLYRPLGERFETLWIRPFLETIGWPSMFADHGAAESVGAVQSYLDNLDNRDDRGGRGGRDGGGGGDAPVFLFVNLMEPHWRYLPPLCDRAELLPEDLGLLRATRIALNAYGPLLMAGQDATEETLRALRSLYAAGVRYQDRRLAELLTAIDARLDPANTVLVVTSDHGENLGEQGRFDHVFALDDRLIHVPLLVRFAPRFPAGKRVPGLCQLLDVPATIAELVPGLRVQDGQTGRTLAPLRFEPRSFVIAEGDPYYGHLERMSAAAGFERDVGRFARPLVAVRTREKKLLLTSRGAPQLFDIARDPAETTDAIAREPGAAEELAKTLEEWRATVPAYARAARPGAAPLSREALERLERMGYTGK